MNLMKLNTFFGVSVFMFGVRCLVLLHRTIKHDQDILSIGMYISVINDDAQPHTYISIRFECICGDSHNSRKF